MLIRTQYFRLQFTWPRQQTEVALDAEKHSLGASLYGSHVPFTGALPAGVRGSIAGGEFGGAVSLKDVGTLVGYTAVKRIEGSVIFCYAYTPHPITRLVWRRTPDKRSLEMGDRDCLVRGQCNRTLTHDGSTMISRTDPSSGGRMSRL
jgi:hypothetical protein